jgi:hypothetical protein
VGPRAAIGGVAVAADVAHTRSNGYSASLARLRGEDGWGLCACAHKPRRSGERLQARDSGPG